MGRHSVPGPGVPPGGDSPGGDEPAEDYPPTGEQHLYEPRESYGYAPPPGGHVPRGQAQPPYADQYEDGEYGDEYERYEDDEYDDGYGDADDGYADDDYADDDYADDDGYADDDHTEAGYPAQPATPASPRYDEPRTERIRTAAARPAGPTRPPGTTTGAHDFSGIDFQGGHRSAQSGRRGVSLGVIISLVAVVVVVASVIAWRFFGDALSDRTDAAAAACTENVDTVAVVVDPSLTVPVRDMAERFNDTANPVGDRCVAVEVKSADSDDVVNGFVGEWPAALGNRPALWIPASTVGSARLESVAGPDTVSDSQSLLTSPVLLAVRPELKPALAAQNWSTLPGLQTNPTSLDGLALPGWGSLRLVLPRTGDSDASYLAAEALAVAAVPAGAPASDGVGAVSTLVAAEPKLDDDSANAALDALLAQGDPAASPVHAVAVTEQQLFARAGQLADAANTLASWQPPGPVAVADYPTVLLKGTWLSPEQQSGAGQFVEYLRQPEQLAEFAKLGFQTEGGSPPTSDIVSFAAPSEVLSVGDNSMRTTLANALTAPAVGPNVSIMLDLSMTEDEGGRTRLANVIAALNDRIGALTPSSSVGLTTFDGSAGATVVTTGPLSEQVDGQPRSELLRSGLDALTATSGGAVSFTTLRNVYSEAVTNFAVGQPNSVLILTAGPHTDQSLDGPGLEETIRSAMDPARPVAINVINFGADPDRPTWESIAQITGGTYQDLASSDSPELATALTTAMS